MAGISRGKGTVNSGRKQKAVYGWASCIKFPVLPENDWNLSRFRICRPFLLKKHEGLVKAITLICGRQRVECSDPVYYSRRDNSSADKHVPSHLVAWPRSEDKMDEICYIRLERERVPVLVTSQPDGSVWLGGAYLDTIAREFRLIPCPLPRELEEKTREWLQAMGDRLQALSGQR